MEKILKGLKGSVMGNFWEGLGYSVINEFLGLFLSRDGFAKSARYEVVIGPPSGIKSGAGGGGTLSAISQALDGNNNSKSKFLIMQKQLLFLAEILKLKKIYLHMGQ